MEASGSSLKIRAHARSKPAAFAKVKTLHGAYRLGEEDMVRSMDMPLPSQGAVTIDGAGLEGGGQIVRIATALAAATGKAVRIERMRAKRDRPGLQPQHLTGVELVAAISGGRIAGAAKGSTELFFLPGDLRAGSYFASPGTAGATTLLLQASLPCLLLAHGSAASPPVLPEAATSALPEAATSAPVSRIEMEGGTDNPAAPPIDYARLVLVPTLLRHLRFDLQVQLKKRGFYPRGGGAISLTVGETGGQTGPPPPVCLQDPGHVTRVTFRAFAAGKLPLPVAHAYLRSAVGEMKRYFRTQGAGHEMPTFSEEAIQETGQTAVGNGAGIIIVAETSSGCLLAGSSFLDFNKRAEDGGREAAEELIHQLRAGSCVDEHMQDQLVVFMAMARGTSIVRMAEPSLHTLTAILIAEQVTDAKFRLVVPPGSKHASYLAAAKGGAIAKEEPSSRSSKIAGVDGKHLISDDQLAEFMEARVRLSSSLVLEIGPPEQKTWVLECEGVGIGQVPLLAS